ncbi:chitinase [Madurella fahalii]|uniref:Chitinase n=1 Tax=Madurella fahalii TaxID=1157608 RepID=A0ABQ0GJT8_9PEZI
MKTALLLSCPLLPSLLSATPLHRLPVVPGLPRLIIYYQTTHDSLGRPISMLPLITENQIALTHLIVCSFHINAGGNMHLNDYPPHTPLFHTLWNETRIMQAAGVKVMGMVGGAAPGSFSRHTLDNADARVFAAYYSQLRDAITTYKLDGMGLDVEERMSQQSIARLVRQLRYDFGPDFLISLAPVASALLSTDGGLSGFSYRRLEYDVGGDIQFYNTQFYNGFGTMASTETYDGIVGAGWPATKIVVGQITSPENGSGFVPHAQLNQTISTLRSRYGEIGGIMGWEYFNSSPGGPARPWEWAQVMTAILRPNRVPRLTITRETARALMQAWKEGTLVEKAEARSETVDAEKCRGRRSGSGVDYIALVNA